MSETNIMSCKPFASAVRSSRRDFLETLGLAGASAALAGCASPFTYETAKSVAPKARAVAPKFMWAYLAHFGMKLWERRLHYDELKVDESMWLAMTERMARRKLNVLLIDLAEGMVYPSHPELAVRGSWEPERMREEIARLKKMGIMAIPKMNFSAAHDQWLCKWRRYLSTPEYYQVCSELIADVAAVFDESPLLHIGFDEERFDIQEINNFQYIRIRRGELWWQDFLWFVNEVESHGMRPWIWSDHAWGMDKKAFFDRMPKRVLQSNWWYGKEFDVAKLSDRVKPHVGTYKTLEEGNYDQMPCGSTYSCRENFGLTVDHCSKIVSPGRLKGYLMAPWYYRTQEDKREKIMTSIDVVGEVIDRLAKG